MALSYRRFFQILMVMLFVFSSAIIPAKSEEYSDQQNLKPVYGKITCTFNASGTAVSKEGVTIIANITASKTLTANEKGITVKEIVDGKAKMINSSGTVDITYVQDQTTEEDNDLALGVSPKLKRAQFSIPMGTQAVAVDIPTKNRIVYIGRGNSYPQNGEGVLSGSIPGHSIDGKVNYQQGLIESAWDGKNAVGSFSEPVQVLIGPGSILWFLKGQAQHLKGVPLITGDVSFKWSLGSAGFKADFQQQGKERGKIILDGSSSTGKIKRYLWTFEAIPGQALPKGVRFDPGARLEGKKIEVVLLAPVKVKLTVIGEEDGQEDSETKTITVIPRNWKTPCSHSNESGALESPPLFAFGNSVPDTINWGRNVCAVCVEEKEDGEIYHVDGKHNPGESYFNLAYTLAGVKHGPFKESVYVDKYKVVIKRKTLVNSNFWSPSPFYLLNMKQRTNILDFIQSTKEHERIHTDLLKEALKEFDPAKELEELFGEHDEEMIEQADRILVTKEAELSNRFNNEAEVRKRLYQQYKDRKGTLVFQKKDQDSFVTVQLYYYNKKQYLSND